MPTATLLDRVAAEEIAPADRGWDLVVDEIRTSCARRAGVGELFVTRHAVGVRSGAAPVFWVHGPGDTDVVTSVLALSPEVREVYVAEAGIETRSRLLATGWVTSGTMTQLVCDRQGWSAGETSGVRELTRADLPEFRRVLAAATEVDETMLGASFGPDFFERAHPAWLLGAYEGSRLVGTVGLRRQQESAMLFALAVEDTARGTGIASGLVRAAIRQAFAAGASFVHALAEPASVRLSLAAGARTVGTWDRLVRG